MGRKLATLASKMGPRHIWRAESQGARKWRCHLMATNLRAQVPALAASDRVSSGTKRFCVFIAELFIERLFFARVSDVVFGMKATCCATACKHCDRVPIAIIAIADECSIMCRWQLHPSPILYVLTPAAYARQTKRLRLFLRVNKCCHQPFHGFTSARIYY